MKAPGSRPRLGFLGVGWIGRQRMHAILDEGWGAAAAFADCNPEVRRALAAELPGAEAVSGLGELLELELDGLVIATPSGQHAEQAVVALERGIPVFCQKPLARNAAEAARVVEAARREDLLLGVDLCYRHSAATQAIARRVRAGALGQIHAIRLTFHNAYGPDKRWFYRRQEAGGGCVIDLGVHLVDLALWLLDFPALVRVESHLSCAGAPLDPEGDGCEDYASAQLQLADGCVVQLACSWRAPAGRDAIIEASFHGTAGGATLRNVDGSFYDFVAEAHEGTTTTTLAEPPDAWGGRAAVDWARRLHEGAGFDPAIEGYLRVAECLDAIYHSGHSDQGQGGCECGS